MADRRQIEGMIKRKEQEIQELETKLKEGMVYLQALQDVLKKFPKEGGDDTEAPSTLRAGSAVAQAREVILSAGKPLHVDDILAQQGKELTRENRTALGGSLSAYVRKGAIFTRTAPNTFGLLQLNKRAENVPEPPADFGVETTEEDIPF